MLLVRHGQLFSIQQTINQDRYEPTAFLVITPRTPSDITFACIVAGLVRARARTS